jgi:hypothetical protein
MLVIGSTVDEPEIVSVPVTGVTDGPAEAADEAAEDSAGDPVLEQAARMTAPARTPTSAGRTRVGWVNGIPPKQWTSVRLEDPGSALTDPHRYIKAT